MKIAIVGSREYTDLKKVVAYVAALPPDTIIVSGGAMGVDSAAEREANVRGMKTEIFRPDWNKFGNRAGFLRNMDIVNAADKVVAFWDNESPGTKSTIDYATRMGKEVEIHSTGKTDESTGRNRQ